MREPFLRRRHGAPPLDPRGRPEPVPGPARTVVVETAAAGGGRARLTVRLDPGSGAVLAHRLEFDRDVNPDARNAPGRA